MAAERKVREAEHQAPAETAPNAENPSSLTEASANAITDAAASPARALQAQLQQSLQGERRVSSVYDMGRILAASSGITAILGIFIFSGIW